MLAGVVDSSFRDCTVLAIKFWFVQLWKVARIYGLSLHSIMVDHEVSGYIGFFLIGLERIAVLKSSVGVLLRMAQPNGTINACHLGAQSR